MLPFFRRNAKRPPVQPVETVPCPHCGADVPANAAACRDCGYDWEAPLDEGTEEGYGDDDFDYEAYVEDEFGSEGLGKRQTSRSLTTWQRGVAVLLVIAFVLSLLVPVLF